jgi:hypothetical protein
MQSLKLNIKSCDNIELLNQYIEAYTGAFYKMYKSPDLLKDSAYLKSFKNQFICTHTINCLVSNVKAKTNAYLAQEEIKKNELQDIERQLQNRKFKTDKELKIKFKLIQKSIYLKQTIGKNISFGGKELQRNITRLSQTIQQQNLTDLELVEKQLLLAKYKAEYKEKRKIPLYLLGQANQNSNRKINFDLNNHTITFKPNNQTKIKIDFYCGKNQQTILSKLQNSILTNPQPITVTISSKYIVISFDESKLEGLALNVNQINRDRKKAVTKEQKKSIYKNAAIEHEQKLLENKVKHRIGAIDLNPNFIGFSIVDYTDKKQIIYTKCYNFTTLNLKTGKSSVTNSYQTNKRKHEICEVYKDIFKICEHFKVAQFSIEDLNFKPKVEVNATEFNRQVKNVWNRTLQTNLISKYCNKLGIKLLEVLPMYSSFIGNMIYSNYDPIASSIELGRRGFYKYEKGKLYDSLTRINQEKLDYLLGENVVAEDWKDLYFRVKDLPYRNKEIKNSTTFKTKKSKIFLVE